MPYTLKKNKFKYKNPDTGNYEGVDVVAERSFADYQSALENVGLQQQTVVRSEGTTQKNAVTAAGTAAVANFPATAAACDTLAGDFAATYVPDQAYAVGDYCTYQYQLYQCKTAIAANTDHTFVTSHWNLITVTDTINDQVDDLKTQINDIVESYGSILPYLYKKDTYLRNDVETPLNGVDLYFVPLAKYGHIDMIWDPANSFYQGLNAAYVFHILNADDTITNIVAGGTGYAEYFFNYTIGQCTIINRTGYKGVYIGVVRGNENSISVFAVNQTGAVLNEYKESFPIKIEKNGKFSSNNMYFRSSNIVVMDPARNINGVKFHVIPGDKLVFENIVSGLNYRGVLFYDNNYIVISTDVTEYTVENEGIYCAFVLDSNPEATTLYIPKNRTKVLYEDVINPPVEINAYKEKKGVAFGTSLTYRGQEGQTGGYLNFLPSLSGMTWDNQGLGSATILEYGSLPKMLPVITGYSDYADKDVCILEGFVNDWYYNTSTLGTWKDTGTTTVCGCVRYALNYIFSQNANITIFLILDHIGKNVSVDCSSLAENAENKTQSEYYDEIAKIAESMGVHVIKEYAESEISENTPQYLRDNIHLTMLGAKQSANTIWACMKKYVPNAVSV